MTIPFAVEACRKIGEYYLGKNLGNYEKTAEEVFRLRIHDVQEDDDKVTIRTSRPGALIGKRGQNVDGLASALGKPIQIEEVPHDILYFLTPEPPPPWPEDELNEAFNLLDEDE
jgi:hypothetical protein